MILMNLATLNPTLSGFYVEDGSKRYVNFLILLKEFVKEGNFEVFRSKDCTSTFRHSVGKSSTYVL